MKTNFFRPVFAILVTVVLLSFGSDLSMGQANTTGSFHVIIVADTQASDIGGGVAMDVLNLEREINRIRAYARLVLNKTVLMGDNLTPGAISAAIDRLKVQPNDTVLFYFCGHGFHVESKPGKWPALLLKNDESVELFSVFEMLKAKNPRLLLTIADCCNNVVPDAAFNRPAFRMEGPVMRKVTGPELYRRLFAQSSGAYISSSSLRGQFAWATPRGGKFTKAFLEGLGRWTEYYAEDGIPAQGPTWDQVFGGLTRGHIYRKGQDVQQAQFEKNPSSR